MKIRLFLSSALIVLSLAATAETLPKGVAVIGTSLSDARLNYSSETNLTRRDCDPVGDGRWICASYENPTIADFDQSQSIVVSDSFTSGDLLSVHWAAYPDSDDLQAMVATKMLLDGNSTVNFITVGGTTSIERVGGMVDDAEALMLSLFPSGIVTESSDFDVDAQVVANSWESTLNSGNSVYVAEGGSSDFTGSVVSVLVDRGVGNLSNIYIVQNNVDVNEVGTDSDTLEMLRNITTYVNIDDGDFANNTPMFNSSALSQESITDFINRSEDSAYGLFWSTAYSYNSSQSIDFSDLVGVLHILENNTISSLDDFADLYFPVTVITDPVIDPIVPTNTNIAYFGSSLGSARNLYFSSTGNSPVDCDPVSSGWICASFNNPQLSDVSEVVDQIDTTPVTVVGNSQWNPDISWKDSYAVDGVCYCDSNGYDHGADQLTHSTPIGEMSVVQICADIKSVLGEGSTIGRIPYNDLQCGNGPPNSAGDEDADACPGRVDIGSSGCFQIGPTWNLEAVYGNQETVTEQPVVTNGNVAIVGADYQSAVSGFAAATTSQRVDCDPVGDGRWICANYQNPSLSDVTGESAVNSSNNNNTNNEINLGNGSIPSSSLYSSGDFISMHYDSCPDRDDIHAAVAGRMVLDYYGFNHGSDYYVVNGTCGYDRPRSNYVTSSSQIFDKLYGSEGSGNGWLDAFNKEAASASIVAERWQQTLEAGKTVWVADGGPMDFTYQVVRQLERNGFNGNYKNIKVVQHSSESHGWNQIYTDDNNFAYLISRAEYVSIDDGNTPGNSTANLHDRDISGEADNALIARIRNNPEYGDEWNVAFDLLNPNDKFDGSDTVEILWILGIKSDVVNDWFDFMDIYLPDDQSAAVSGDSSILKVQAEDGSNFSGSGWVVENSLPNSENSYLVWRGDNKFRVTDSNPPTGVKSYDFSISQAGTYTFVASVQSRVGNNSGANDVDNDAWVKFTSGLNVSNVNGQADKWTKFFQAGALQAWNSYSNGEQYDPNLFTNIKRYLPVGNHRILIGGRSERFAIDWVGLSIN